QLGGFIKSPATIASGGIPASFEDRQHTLLAHDIEPTKNKKRRSKMQSTSVSKRKEALDLVNKPQTYSSPIQQWKVAEKAIWLLFVIKKENIADEASCSQLAKTFNKHFKEAKMIQPSNVSRD